MQINHMAILASKSIRSGFLPSPRVATTIPPTMKPRLRKSPQGPPGLHGDEQQTVGVHQGHEDPAQEVVEGVKEDQAEEPGNEPNRPNRSPQVNSRAR